MSHTPDHEKQPSRDPATPKKRTNEIKITSPSEGKTTKESMAWALVHIPIQAAETVTTYLKAPFNDCMHELVLELTKQVVAVNQGDMSTAEGLLISQAHTLDAIYNRLAKRAMDQEYMNHLESFLKLALRAQSQCARTLETLSTIKNPPNVAFVKQANIAHNQQVNNGTKADQPPTTQPPVIDSTPQLEHTHGNYLDTGTAAAASRTNSATATVATIHRTKDCQREG